MIIMDGRCMDRMQINMKKESRNVMCGSIINKTMTTN